MTSISTDVDSLQHRLRQRTATVAAAGAAFLLGACSTPPAAMYGARQPGDSCSSESSEIRATNTAPSQFEARRDATIDPMCEIRVAFRQASSALDAGTQADRDTSAAFNLADASREAAAGARRQAELADAKADRGSAAAAEKARQNAAELQGQIDVLRARTTDRGLVVTLGDQSFASGTAKLSDGANDQLGKLATFLNKNPERNSLIEGYTDNVGAEDYNQGLSERRAESVRTYLVAHGIAPTRLTAAGKGESQPIGDNDSASGRRKNRRVEVTIENKWASN